MITKILEYQAVDEELQKIEKELVNSRDRLLAKQAQNYLKEAEENLKKMDVTAAELFAAFQKIAADYDAEKGNLTDFSDNAVGAAEDVEELKYLGKKVTRAGEVLTALEREMAGVVKKIEELNRTFNTIKNKVPQVKKMYVESRQRFEIKKKEKDPEVDALTKKLNALEKQNDPKLLAVYKRLRQENTLPAVVQLCETDKCGGCRMNIPEAMLGKLSSAENYVLCDNCGRIVYK